MTRRILVTGAAGFAGSHIARALLERGESVVALDLEPELPSFITEALDTSSLIQVVGDVAATHQVADVIRDQGITDVVHTAAAMGDEDSIKRPRHFLLVNTEAVWGLCDLARQLPIRRMVLMSSRSVYGAYRPEEGPVPEDAAPRPINFYGASKAAADIVAIQYRQQYSIDLVLPRVTGLYGPHQRTQLNILAQMVAAAASGMPFNSHLAADYRYEVLYVKDMARGVLALLDAPVLSHAVYNIGTGLQPTVGQLADVVRSVIPGAEIHFDHKAKSNIPPRALMAPDRLAAETGFTTAWTVDQAVRELANWHMTGSSGRAVLTLPISADDQ